VRDVTLRTMCGCPILSWWQWLLPFSDILQGGCVSLLPNQC
jgi:hypothetical protein